jgi:hypothetical protein
VDLTGLVVLYVNLARNKDRRLEFEERVASAPVERMEPA